MFLKTKKVMKKITTLLLIVQFTIQSIASREIITTNPSQLPIKALTFIGENYPENRIIITHIEKNDYRILSYAVTLDNGCDIIFEENGNWREIECLRLELSPQVIPKKIKDYLHRKKNDDDIVRISKKRGYYIVELSKKTILIFDFKFNIIKQLMW